MNNEPELIDRRTEDEDLFVHIHGRRFRIHSAELKYLPEGCFSGPRNEDEASVPRAVTLGLEPAPDALAMWLDAHRKLPPEASGHTWSELIAAGLLPRRDVPVDVFDISEWLPLGLDVLVDREVALGGDTLGQAN